MPDGRILCLDIGEKYIGCAISDKSQILATPLETIKRINGGLCLGKIKKIILLKEVQSILIGYPLILNSKKSQYTRKVKGYFHKLKKHLKEIDICLYDETLSTWSARHKYKHLRLQKSTKTLSIDSFSALEILEGYLDFHH